MHIKRLTQLAEWLEGGAKHQTITFNMKEGIQPSRTAHNQHPRLTA